MPTRVRGLKRGTQSEGCQIGGIRTTQGFLRGELSGATGLRRPLQWAPTGASSGRPRRSMMDDRTLFWYHRRMSLSSRRCLGSAASSTIFRGRTSELCKPEHERVPKVECVGQDLNLGPPARPAPDSRDSGGRGSYLAPLAKLSYPRAKPRKILRDKTFAEVRGSLGAEQSHGGRSPLPRRLGFLDLHPSRGLVDLESPVSQKLPERVPVDDLEPVVLPVRELDCVLRPLHESRLQPLPLRNLDCAVHADGFHRHVGSLGAPSIQRVEYNGCERNDGLVFRVASGSAFLGMGLLSS